MSGRPDGGMSGRFEDYPATSNLHVEGYSRRSLSVAIPVDALSSSVLADLVFHD
jgi:hypothetical protein